MSSDADTDARMRMRVFLSKNVQTRTYQCPRTGQELESVNRYVQQQATYQKDALLIMKT